MAPIVFALAFVLSSGLGNVLVAEEVAGLQPDPAAPSAEPAKRPWNELDASWISVRLEFQAFEDGVFFSQDAANKEQVGDLSSTALFRVDCAPLLSPGWL